MPEVRIASLVRFAPCGLPYPLSSPGVRVFAQARQALCLGVVALGLRPGDEVLVPGYHHGAEVEALLRAGLRCRRYETRADLEPDEEVLDELCGSRTRALHLVHHLGFPQDAARWRRWCDERGLLLIEDGAQAWLAERDGVPVGSHGDLAVFCLYKSVAVPDGGAARCRTALPAPELPGGTGVLRLARTVLRAQLSRVGVVRSPGEYDQERDIALPKRSSSACTATRWLIGRCSPDEAAQSRRDAYTQLLTTSAHLVPAAFAQLPSGASPFAFPVAVADKEIAMRTLRQRGILATDLWRVPHPALPDPQGSIAALFRRHLVGLPVHPALRAEDVDRIASAAARLIPAESLQLSPLKAD